MSKRIKIEVNVAGTRRPVIINQSAVSPVPGDPLKGDGRCEELSAGLGASLPGHSSAPSPPLNPWKEVNAVINRGALINRSRSYLH